MNAGVHACALFFMQAANEFERSQVETLASCGPMFDGAFEFVSIQLPPMPAAEGPSAIPKNSTGTGPAPQAVMFPPTHPPHIN